MATSANYVADPYFKFGDTDLTDQCQGLTLGFDLDELERTVSADGAHCYFPGLEKCSCSVNLLRNWGAGSVDAALWAAKGTEVAVIIRRKKAVKAADNPEYTFTAWAKWDLLSGAVGAKDEVTVNLVFASVVGRSTGA